jgi:hypothetical protein
MTPLFGGSRRTSMHSSYSQDTQSNQGNYNGHQYPVPAQVGYFNPLRESVDSNKAIIGLNGSNEKI